MCDVRCLVTDIQRFCHDDGPGIRTTVFTKGCPLHCTWCHNPETYSVRQEIFYTEEQCIGCGRCASSCAPGAHVLSDGIHSFDRSKCRMCGECVSACPSGALEFCAKEMTPEDVYREAMKDASFFETSGGGVTFSGGEPLIHPEFIAAAEELLKKDNIHTAIETSLFVSNAALLKVIPYTDLFLVDYKCLPDDYGRFTGGSFGKIAENITTLSKKGLPVVLRCPIIKGVNHSDVFFESILGMTERFTNITEVDLEPYHPLGLSKSRRLGTAPEYENGFLERNEISFVLDEIKDRFRVPVIIK